MLESADESLELLIGAERVRIRSLEQPEELGRRAAGRLLRAHEKVADRQQRGHVEEVVEISTLNLVLAAPIEVLQESSRIERVGINFEQREVGPDRRGLHLTVPAPEVFAPKLALEHRCARRKAAPDLGVSARELVATPPSGGWPTASRGAPTGRAQ